MNPFFNFAYAGVTAGLTISNNWRSHSAAPVGEWHADAMATLYGFPLDRRDWQVKNSHRLDIVKIESERSKDPYLHTDSNLGRRVNGRVLPVENRYFTHWNTDPWELDYNGQGTELGAGTVFLLPYYMGLYHGFIQKP